MSPTWGSLTMLKTRPTSGASTGGGTSRGEGSSSTISVSRARIPQVSSALPQNIGTTSPASIACFSAATRRGRGISSPSRYASRSSSSVAAIASVSCSSYLAKTAL